MITQEYLKSIITYNPDTGIFVRKNGRIPKYVGKNGYMQISIQYKKYYLHRLAWLYMYGFMPEKEIDHINGNKSDNRICNLREATRTQNRHNTKVSKRNKSGHKNISLHTTSKLWRVVMYKNGTTVVNKYFKEIDDAIDFSKKMRKEIYGNFARID